MDGIDSTQINYPCGTYELAHEVAGLPSEQDAEDEEAKRFDLLILNLQLATLRYGDPFRVNDEYGYYERVTREDVQRVARLYLTTANRTVVTAEPVQR